MSGLREYFAYAPGRADYLTRICRRHRAVFIEVPKAGCTVVKSVLQASERDTEPPPGQSLHDRSVSPLAAPKRDGFDADELFGPDSSYFRFSFVRNPYSRALSCYLDRIVRDREGRDRTRARLGLPPSGDVSFRVFLERVAEQRPVEMDIHWAPQALLLALDKVQYGFIGRFENLRPDLAQVMQTLGLPAPLSLLEVERGYMSNARSAVAEYYDPDCAALVRSIYRRDFRRLGYGSDLRFA